MSPTGQELKGCPVLILEACKMSTRAAARRVTADPHGWMSMLQAHLSDTNQLPYTGSEETLTVKVIKGSFSCISLSPSLYPHLVPKNVC